MLTFEDIVRKRFLDVEVFACLKGPDSLNGVLVVWASDGDGINIFIFKHLTDVGVAYGARTIDETFSEDIGVNIAKCDDANTRHFLNFFNMFEATAAEADDGNSNFAVRA